MMNDDYSEHLGIATQGMLKALPLLSRAIDNLQQQDNYSVADFGVADGGTSIPVWQHIRQALQRKDAQRIDFFLSDLPSTNASKLFEHTAQIADDHTHVFVNLESFYNKVCPPASLDLAFSANALHYLAASPCILTEVIHANTAPEHEKSVFLEASNQAWHHILHNRAEELRPGGLLVAQMVNVDQEGRYMGNNNTDYNMWLAFARHWGEVRNEGLISDEVFQAAQISHYLRTDKQLLDIGDAPFEIVETQATFTECPFRKRYNQHQDAKAFANDYLKMLRTWSEVIFRRTGASNEAIDRLYELYHESILNEPNKHSMDLPHLNIVLRRLSTSAKVF